MRASLIFVLVLCVVLAPGCATILRGSTQQVTVACEYPNATLYIDGIQTAPGVQTLKRDRFHYIKAEMPDYPTANLSISNNISFGWLLISFLSFGILGTIVDTLTGALYALEPEIVNVRFAKSDGSTLLPQRGTTPTPTPIPTTPNGHFCASCGGKMGDARFCPSCGKGK